MTHVMIQQRRGHHEPGLSKFGLVRISSSSSSMYRVPSSFANVLYSHLFLPSVSDVVIRLRKSFSRAYHAQDTAMIRGVSEEAQKGKRRVKMRKKSGGQGEGCRKRVHAAAAEACHLVAVWAANALPKPAGILVSASRSRESAFTSSEKPRVTAVYGHRSTNAQTNTKTSTIIARYRRVSNLRSMDLPFDRVCVPWVCSVCILHLIFYSLFY